MNENDIDQSLLELLARYFYYIDPKGSVPAEGEMTP